MARKEKPQGQPSGSAPADTLTVTITRGGETVGMLMLSGRVFKTGNTGYFGTGKVEIDGRRFQAQAQLAAIRPK